MNRFIIQKSGPTIPAEPLCCIAWNKCSAIASCRGNTRKNDQKDQYQNGNANHGNLAENNNGRHHNGAHNDAVASGELRGAAGSGLCAGGRSRSVILICISKTEHSMTSFHVSLIFDGLILAREAEYVNIAYYPNRKSGKSGHFYDIDKIYSPDGKFSPSACRITRRRAGERNGRNAEKR